MDPITLAVALAVGSTIGEIYFQKQSADTKKQALDLQLQEQRLQTQQKTLSNYDTMQNVLSTQEAQLTQRGVTSASPSFNAIQRQTVNIAAKEQKNLELEGSIAERNLKLEKKNVNQQLYSQIFGDVAGAATGFASIAAKMPTKTPAAKAA